MASTKSRRIWPRASLAIVLLAAGSPGIAADPAPIPAAGQAAAPADLRLALLAIRINGIDQPDPVWVLYDADALYVTGDAALAWRLVLKADDTRLFEGETYLRLDTAEGLVAGLDDATQTLSITAPAALFMPSSALLSGRTDGPMTRSGIGGFLNYDLSAQTASGASSLDGLFELGAFSGAGTMGTGFIAGTGNSGDGRRSLVRLDTNWTIDDPARLRSLRIGDGVTRGSTGTGALRFAGLQLATNFATQPGYLTMALPTLNGSAAVPSVVDLYVNNILQNRQSVASGPFALTDVPVVNGSGDIQLVVRDALGRETRVTQSYYAAPQILRRGLHDFSYEIGVLRRNFTRASFDYGTPILSATHRYGVTERLTVEAHGETTRKMQATSMQVSALWPAVGIFSLSAAGSHSDRGGGGLFGIGFERQTRGLSLGGNGEITTADYATVGDSTAYRRARSTVTGFIGTPTPYGSVTASLLWRRSRDQRGDILSGNANASMRLRRIGALSLNASRSFAGARDTTVQFRLTVPFGQRTSATAGVQLRDGELGATTTLQRNLPYGDGVGYRLQAETGAIERLDAEVNAQSGIGRIDAQVTRLNGASGGRLQLVGSVATVDGAVFAARRIEQSFGTVRVGPYANVRVYSDNQLVGRTNAAGVLVIPRLLPFQDNHIRIEAEDLPLDAIIDETKRTVRPYDRSGVAVRFGARAASDARLRVVGADGNPLPAGTVLHLNGAGEAFLLAPGGDAYLTGLATRNRVSATFAGGGCAFAFDFVPAGQTQPDLGTFTCTS
ncbi:fimbrial biogenesis outer membrane usher protein [Sphingomonas sp. CFBP 13714]|uniref:fimbria/pilus outer membrane usher protein n=1 Tax=Sphingomonas sp. CFBP 13714 TaxID=2775308 RepID=UPI00177B81C1|nr:fimbria/pilus outer membrane usher protein [Sphingomonas sp. CFBP 13714]MBD8698641.1 fimbrial biogenesis outer membrane usher protein [Sphingomonas sp. CFBP 13714]